MLVPFGNGSCVAVCALYYILSRNSAQFLFSALPPAYQTLPVFLVLFSLEIFLFFSWLIIGHHNLFLQTLFFQKISRELDTDLSSVRSKSRFRRFAIDSICKGCVTIQLNTKIFNQLWGTMIFLTKICCLCMTIFGFFITIRHFMDAPIFSALNFNLGVYGLIIFTVIYNNAFSIPDKMHRYKDQILVAVKRISTLEFLDFVAIKTCSLLLTFR
ncbi:unnamed protein product [Allacma fusca]|uniref:Uncharacterized protein n=1 Tax=Allacma fusca TaxID=39272 RepID=A0A8J2K924_9HEXA|nr:unnamed protein product [Allacma fusca]